MYTKNGNLLKAIDKSALQDEHEFIEKCNKFDTLSERPKMSNNPINLMKGGSKPHKFNKDLESDTFSSYSLQDQLDLMISRPKRKE